MQVTDAAVKGHFFFAASRQFPYARPARPPAPGRREKRAGPKTGSLQPSTFLFYQIIPSLSTQTVLLLWKSVFCTSFYRAIYTFLHLVIASQLCYITIRKGDTNVQVNLKTD